MSEGKRQRERCENREDRRINERDSVRNSVTEND